MYQILNPALGYKRKNEMASPTATASGPSNTILGFQSRTEIEIEFETWKMKARCGKELDQEAGQNKVNEREQSQRRTDTLYL